MRKKHFLSVFVFVATFGLGVLFSVNHGAGQSDLASTLDVDLFTSQVQPVLERRCIACHGCYSSPCQYNLQSVEGILRGGSKANPYETTRLKSVPPTRLGIDAHSFEEWKQKGFFDVTHSGILQALLELKNQNPNLRTPGRSETAPRQCVQNSEELNAYIAKRPQGGMPYGLPALDARETEILRNWIGTGTPLPTRPTVQLTDEERTQIGEWNQFFNDRNPRQQLVSRYLYEHLYLAHIYFASESDQTKTPHSFFRMIRSRSSCERPEEVTTPRPNEDPQVQEPFYCLIPLNMSIVEKSHLPYSFSRKRMDRYKQLFFSENWAVQHPPSYVPEVAGNPFVAFQDIPGKARYQFLLDDSRYHVSTFIKGPVCNGTVAVNSIQEQFYVFFLQPDADPLVRETDFVDSVKDLLVLPGAWGRDMSLMKAPALLGAYG